MISGYKKKIENRTTWQVGFCFIEGSKEIVFASKGPSKYMYKHEMLFKQLVMKRPLTNQNRNIQKYMKMGLTIVCLTE